MANETTQLKSISDFNYEACLKCSICTAYCPVIAVNPDYPGPKQCGPDGLRYRLKDPVFFDEALKKCLNCKRCEVACPEGVLVGDIIQKARMTYSTHRAGLRDTILANTDFVGTMANRFAPLVNATLKLGVSKVAMDAIIKVDKHRTFPAYASKRFVTWFKREVQAKQASYSKQVSYFHGCYVNYNFPKMGQDFVHVMNAVGYGVQLLDKERCCGVAKIANGLFKQVKRHAQINIDSMNKAVQEKGTPVLTTSSTCTFTLRDEYRHVLDLDNSGCRDQISLVTRFLCRLVDEGKVKLAFRSDYHKRVAYHTSCHMERMGWVPYTLKLLRMIPGLELTILDSNCCGMSGTYGFKKENYPTSQAVGAPLFKQITEVAPESVVTECETCKWQIEMTVGVPVENPICLLADALDFEKTAELNS